MRICIFDQLSRRTPRGTQTASYIEADCVTSVDSNMADAAAGDADMDPFEAIEGFVAPLAALPPDMSSLRVRTCVYLVGAVLCVHPHPLVTQHKHGSPATCVWRCALAVHCLPPQCRGLDRPCRQPCRGCEAVGRCTMPLPDSQWGRQSVVTTICHSDIPHLVSVRCGERESVCVVRLCWLQWVSMQ